MKKLLSLLLTFCLIFSLTACGSSADSSSSEESEQSVVSSAESSDNETEEESSEESSETTSDETLGEFNQDATIEETVLYDQDNVVIKATGLNYTNYSVELDVSIENNSDKDLSFVSGSLGYSCNSINGYMVNDGYLNCDVASGKKANDTISFNYDSLMLYGINEVADMEIAFSISDDDFNYTYSGPCALTTSAYDSHDYDTDLYQETITSDEAINTYNYEMSAFSQDTLYDVNGVKVLSSGIIVNKDGETGLLLELENTTSDIVNVVTSDISLNGLLVYSSNYSSDTINPGKKAIVDIMTSAILDSEYWSVYGIDEIGSIGLALSQNDSENNEISDKTNIEVTIPNAKAEFDASGTEVYNNNGLRIVAKTVLEDSSEYSGDMHVLLLAENTSGKTLEIDDVYDSVSVNSVMTDYLFSGEEIPDGKSAVLDIQLQESSLEDNGFASTSDISDVEISLDISDENDTIDSPTLTISFE